MKSSNGEGASCTSNHSPPGEICEYANVFGNLYGTPKDWVISTIAKGFDVILELDVQGALQVKNVYPDAKTIFIIPTSYKDLENRLVKRGLDSQETIEKRLSEAKQEIISGKDFDYLITNDDFDLAEYFLLNADVAVVPGTAFGAKNHIRISFATSFENLKKAVERIKKVLV